MPDRSFRSPEQKLRSLDQKLCKADQSFRSSERRSGEADQSLRSTPLPFRSDAQASTSRSQEVSNLVTKDRKLPPEQLPAGRSLVGAPLLLGKLGERGGELAQAFAAHQRALTIEPMNDTATAGVQRLGFVLLA